LPGGVIRAPAVAELFYPGEKGRLRQLIESLCPQPPVSEGEKVSAQAVLAPHAGYMYSGKVAAAVFARARITPVVVILCFNHRGAGASFAIWPGSAWETPLGRAEVDERFGHRLKTEFPMLEEDARAHEGEHSGEVMLPFLQYFRPDVKIVPISLNAWRDDPGTKSLTDFGEALSRTVTSLGEDTLVVASSDLNHYEREDTTHEKDRIAIEAMVSLDPGRLRKAVAGENITMCGFAPAIAAMTYARIRGATGGTVEMHATSGDVSGDRERVVGYAGILFH
jgi:AmmeMemoRadiSam system protein B